jgi:predicted ATPase/class 3 adenylate cyclase
VPDPAAPARPARALPTGTVTLLFTDIEGSTRLSTRVGDDRYRELLTTHRGILRDAVARHGGLEFGTEGDAFFAVFASAPGAIAAAADGQRDLEAYPWPDAERVRVRMGLHTGEVAHEQDGGYVGLALHRVARITAAGHGGQVLISSATQAVVGDGLPRGTSLTELGRHHLKDFDEPERLFQLHGPGIADEFPPVRTIDATPNNLPRQLTSFVGRETVIAEARRLLEGTRLLTLTGPGGTGKTRLSIRLAEEMVSDHPDGVYFIALAAIRDVALVPSVIAGTLRLADSAGRSPMDTIAEYLRDRRVLLVLDNFEQIMGAAPFVAELLRATSDVHVLVTSRAALRVSGEQEFPVPPLGLPDPKHPGGASALSQYEAVALFIERAATVRPDFRITNENAPAVAEICARLDGLPLAIELAAARVRLLSPQAILPRLEKRLGLLSGGARDLPERQQTLRGAIAWSHDLLDAPSRTLFRRLAVFAGGCSFESAQAVCDPDGGLGIDVFEGVGALVDQSLLRQEERAGEPRLLMLETIREFGLEQLASSGEETEVRGRHALHYAERAELAAPLVEGPDRALWLDRGEADHDNYRAAIDLAIEAHDAVLASRLLAALWRFWQSRDHLAEGAARADAILAVPGHVPPDLRARAHEAAGGIAWWAGDIKRVQQEYTTALELARAVGEPRLLADALYNLSFAYSVSDRGADDIGDPRHLEPGEQVEVHRPANIGRALIEEAADLYRQLNDDAGLGRAVWALGNYQYFGGQYAEAAASFEEALDLARRSGDTFMTGWSLHMLGSAEVHTGRLSSSHEHMLEAMRLMRAAGEMTGLVIAFDDISYLSAAAGDLPRSARLAGAARALEEATGARLAGITSRLMARGDMPAADLAPGEYERCVAEGRAMGVESAIELAFALPEPQDLPPDTYTFGRKL